MSEWQKYRTPREVEDTNQHRLRVLPLIEQARTDGTSMQAAIRLGESPEVVEGWIDTFWNGLHALSREDLEFAFALVLKPDMDAAACRLVADSGEL